MQLGWVDFSKSERNKVLTVLDSLGERGILDELGIASIRDGFSDLFFPGTSTLQTKAKYYLIVPYACKEVEASDILVPSKARSFLDTIEKECAEKLCAVHSDDKRGIIGNDAIARHSWVKRAPSVLYWAGLRKYGIFTQGNLSISGYMKVLCAQKSRKKQEKSLGKLGNRNDTEEIEQDDIDAGEAHVFHFIDLPVDYNRDTWKDDLSLRLTKSEAVFLKEKIIMNARGSLLALVLERNLKEFSACNSFEDMRDLIPAELRAEYQLAIRFSKFMYALRVIYNDIVSNGENECARNVLLEIQSNIEKWTEVDIEAIFNKLSLHNDKLKRFLLSSQKALRDNDIELVKKCIKEREKNIKGESRAKTYHPGQFDPQAWFGGTYLDYRFSNAKILISDIFEGENADVQSE